MPRESANVSPEGRHPPGLYILCLTQMCGRFCYNGTRALLVLYIARHLAEPEVARRVVGWDGVRRLLEALTGPLDAEQLADQVYGVYTAFAYLSPAVSGMLADRLLGSRRSVITGALMILVGQLLMLHESLFYAALVLLALGGGSFRASLITQLGALYGREDARHDRAFTIFYAAGNAGGLLAPLLAGGAGQILGWDAGFEVALGGAFVGLIVYLVGSRYLPEAKPARKRDEAPPSTELTASQRRTTLALLVLCVLSVPFWSVYDQQGNSLQFWADASTERHVLRWLGSDWEMPSTWFQSFNGVFLLALTPLVGFFWKRRRQASSVAKMATGCMLLGLSFVVMIGAARVVSGGARASLGWLVLSSVLLSTGEIYVSPVSLSLVARVAPVRVAGAMVGAWFVAIFFGNLISGTLATFAHRVSSVAFFGMLAAIAFVTGLVLLALRAPLTRATS
jgi:proton-dependent oligopeptide transporter, POT family